MKIDHRFNYAILFIALCTSFFFLGRGITGMVISETCCYGPDCSGDSLCDNINMEKTEGKDLTSMFIGASLFITSVTGFVSMHKPKE
jgi:hypothetical protein